MFGFLVWSILWSVHPVNHAIIGKGKMERKIIENMNLFEFWNYLEHNIKDEVTGGISNDKKQ